MRLQDHRFQVNSFEFIRTYFFQNNLKILEAEESNYSFSHEKWASFPHKCPQLTFKCQSVRTEARYSISAQMLPSELHKLNNIKSSLRSLKRKFLTKRHV